MLIAALAVAIGFYVAASNVGPAYGMAAAFTIFIGALLGSIAFCASIAFTVAMIGSVKLQRLNRNHEN